MITSTLKAGSQLVIQTSVPAGAPTSVGWAHLTTTGGISGFGVFAYGSGSALQEAGANVDNRVAGAYVVPFDNTNGYATGVAVANVTAKNASIPLTIRDDNGVVLATDTLTLPAMGHTSFVVLTSYPLTAQKRGTVEFDAPSGGQISVLGLRGNPAGGFTSVPSVTR